MSNHIHSLVQAKENNLSDALRDFKKFTSQQITKAIEANPGESRKRWLLWLLMSEKATEKNPAAYRFWQPGNGAEQCFSLSCGAASSSLRDGSCITKKQGNKSQT